MRKLLPGIALILAASSWSVGQVLINDVNINEMPDLKYIQVMIGQKSFSVKTHVEIDYGQTAKSMADLSNIAGTDKKPLVFKSKMDVINFLYKNGWEFVSMYMVPSDGTTYYLLSKKETPKTKN